MSNANHITIRLNTIKLFAHHGAYEEERLNGNHFEIDIAVDMKIPIGAQSDKLEDTLDYVSLVKTVARISKEKQYYLLEAFANDICKMILQEQPTIDRVTVEVRKLHPPMELEVESVGVLLTISR